jgi:hypothetical protein
MAVENDIVLIYFEEKPLAFARIENILPDSKIPLQVVTWILKDVYISGTEFTMNGKKMRLEKVETPVETETSDSQEGKETKKEISEEAAQNNKGAKVISLEDLKRK